MSLFNKDPRETTEKDYTLFLVEEEAIEPIPGESEKETPTVFITEDDDTSVPTPDKAAKGPFWKRALQFCIPLRGDSVPLIIQKSVMLLAAVVAIVAAGYLIYDLWIVPLNNESVNKQISALYDPEELPEEVLNYDEYPEGIRDAFKALYYTNPDIRGWLTFNSTSKNWYGIDYPVVQGEDNGKYLYVDFYGNQNKNGTLFFDERNDFSSAEAKNRVTIVHGHNMLSGQMLASVNKLLGGVGYARSAPTIELSTLYADATYKVFSVFIWDNEQPDFNYMKTEFYSDSDFLEYVGECRIRSWYNYQDVDVLPEDELLVLSTCSNKSQTHLSDGRTIVVARKVRPDESMSINTAHIVANKNPLQPRAWYEAEGQELPAYYDTASSKTTKKTTTTKATTTTTAAGSTAEDASATTSTTTTTAKKPGNTTTKKPVNVTPATTTTKKPDVTTTTPATTPGSTTTTTSTTTSTTSTTTGTTTTTTAETTTSTEATTTAVETEQTPAA